LTSRQGREGIFVDLAKKKKPQDEKTRLEGLVCKEMERRCDRK
jgi:hypothetical protein